MSSPSALSGIRDNHSRGTVADFLRQKAVSGSKLSVVSACFTICAYDALRSKSSESLKAHFARKLEETRAETQRRREGQENGHDLDSHSLRASASQRDTRLNQLFSYTEEPHQFSESEVATLIADNNDDYGRKLYLIENCLYGVDIQPIATGDGTCSR